MSVNFEAYVVVGIAVVCKTASIPETRYDELTGKPYQKSVNKTFWETDKGVPLAFDPCDLTDMDPEKLQSFTSNQDRGGVVGIKLAETKDDWIDDAVPVPGKEKQLSVHASVTRQLEERACVVLPTMLLIMTCG